MNIVASFKHSVYLELAITSLEQEGIKRENIMAVPLNMKREKTRLFDTLHRSDGASMLDLAFILGTVFAVPGASYGFVAEWGPVICGLLAAGTGLVLGLIIRLVMASANRERRSRAMPEAEVMLIVQCGEDILVRAENILWDHQALGMALLGDREGIRP